MMWSNLLVVCGGVLLANLITVGILSSVFAVMDRRKKRNYR